MSVDTCHTKKLMINGPVSLILSNFSTLHVWRQQQEMDVCIIKVTRRVTVAINQTHYSN
jgi:hypothetical protein